MTHAKILAAGLFLAALALAGCGDTKPDDKKDKDKDKDKAAKHGGKDDHTHGKGPNGGVVFDLGRYHAEFTVDHDRKECTILFVTEDSKDGKPIPVAAKEFTLITKETQTKDGKKVAPMTIKMMPKEGKDDKTSKFVGTDPGLGNVADFEGTVVGEIDGKPAKGTFKE